MKTRIFWISVFVLYCLIVQLVGIAIFLQAVSIIVTNTLLNHGVLP